MVLDLNQERPINMLLDGTGVHNFVMLLVVI
jgi:hypothetical protein